MSTADRIKELEAEIASLGGQVDYKDPAYPLADRVRAAEEARDLKWTRALKDEQAKRLLSNASANGGQVQARDFVDANDTSALTLREQIDEAREAGDAAKVQTLTLALARATNDAQVQASPMMAAARAFKERMEASGPRIGPSQQRPSYADRIAAAEAAGDLREVGRLETELRIAEGQYRRDQAARRLASQ